MFCHSLKPILLFTNQPHQLKLELSRTALLHLLDRLHRLQLRLSQTPGANAHLSNSSTSREEDESDDPDLAAAIRLSLEEDQSIHQPSKNTHVGEGTHVEHSSQMILTMKHEITTDSNNDSNQLQQALDLSVGNTESQVTHEFAPTPTSDSAEEEDDDLQLALQLSLQLDQSPPDNTSTHEIDQ